MARAAPDPSFESLLEHIRAERGFDYTSYKRPTLTRRFEKRMQALGVESYEEYRSYLDRNPDEYAELFDTILINVTGFFRDPPAWEYLGEEIVPRVLESRGDGESLRLWSAGCSSGEEAYTLAILIAERLGEDVLRDRVKIYATDVDDHALGEGRHASYPPKRLEGMPEELRERYFERLDHRYVFRHDLRRSVIFGRHDLLADPPISRIDLLTARNTLMYFTTDAQARILANFHFALRESGYLFLGKSEVLMTRSNLFVPVDLRRRVFMKVPRFELHERPPRPTAIPRREESLGALAEEALVREAGFEASPVAQLVVDTHGTLVLANQQARALFALTNADTGKPLRDLELSYKPVELRSRIDQVSSEHHAISIRDVDWATATGDSRVVDVQLVPLFGHDGDLLGVGISFADVTRYRRMQDAVDASRREMETAYEELQSTVEELETTNEELQSTNEELETTNEELQSTNEELETMNEELQSTNEELEAINDELNERTDELGQASAFLESILASLAAGVVVVDRELRVKAWNDLATDLWGLRAEEVEGQHFMNLDLGLPVDLLHAPIRATLADGDNREVVVPATSRRGRSIQCRVLVTPLQTRGGGPTGAILLMEEAESQA